MTKLHVTSSGVGQAPGVQDGEVESSRSASRSSMPARYGVGSGRTIVRRSGASATRGSSRSTALRSERADSRRDSRAAAPTGSVGSSASAARRGLHGRAGLAREPTPRRAGLATSVSGLELLDSSRNASAAAAAVPSGGTARPGAPRQVGPPAIEARVRAPRSRAAQPSAAGVLQRLSVSTRPARRASGTERAGRGCCRRRRTDSSRAHRS